MAVNALRDMQARRPGQAVGSRGAMSWYLTATGEIIRGQVQRDPDWEDRKREVYGDIKFLGHAEYGPGQDPLPALVDLLPRNPELQEHIDRIVENKKRKAYERANREQVRARKKAEEKAEQTAMIASALRSMDDLTGEATDTQPDTPKRGPGRPRKQPEAEAAE